MSRLSTNLDRSFADVADSPVPQQQRQDACRICGATEGEPAMTVGSTFASTWVACAGCGVRRISPYPSTEELAAYYDDGYREKDDFSALGFEVNHRLRYSPDYVDRLQGEYAQSLADVDIAIAPAMRVLDYGCADGCFLDFLTTREVPAEHLCGIDVSRQMIGVVTGKGFRGLTVTDQDRVLGEQFDLITMWDVIEHVPDPVATLSWLAKLMAPDGRLLMQTPRIGLLSEALGDRFEHYLPFEHLHLFTREALCEAGRRAGLTATRWASFGANAPAERIPMPYKRAWDQLAKATDNGATQLLVLSA